MKPVKLSAKGLKQGSSTYLIKQVAMLHNLLSISQLCDKGLKVARDVTTFYMVDFRKTSFKYVIFLLSKEYEP